MTDRLGGKTALITGGTSGIGLATAELFVREGARVIITGRDVKRLEAARTRLGESVVAIESDVRSPQDLAELGDAVSDWFGERGLDIYFANAGIAFSTPLETTDEDRFDELMNINVKGLFFSMQKIAPRLRNGASVILNSAWLNTVGTPGFSVLSATKAVVRSFARTWSAELLDRRIRVNCVSPGAIDTPIFDLEGGSPEQVAAVKKQLATHIPAGYLGTAEDIAHAVTFLASDESRYMIGSEIMVDGGFSQL